MCISSELLQISYIREAQTLSCILIFCLVKKELEAEGRSSYREFNLAQVDSKARLIDVFVWFWA